MCDSRCACKNLRWVFGADLRSHHLCDYSWGDGRVLFYLSSSAFSVGGLMVGFRIQESFLIFLKSPSPSPQLPTCTAPVLLRCRKICQNFLLPAATRDVMRRHDYTVSMTVVHKFPFYGLQSIILIILAKSFPTGGGGWRYKTFCNRSAFWRSCQSCCCLQSRMILPLLQFCHFHDTLVIHFYMETCLLWEHLNLVAIFEDFYQVELHLSPLFYRHIQVLSITWWKGTNREKCLEKAQPPHNRGGSDVKGFRDFSEPVSCGWCWKPFIWFEAVPAQRHTANMKCAPPSAAVRGSPFDIFYPKPSRQPGRDGLGCCQGLSVAAQIRLHEKKAKRFGMEVSALIDAAPAILWGRQV